MQSRAEANKYLWTAISQVLKPKNQELNLWCHPDAQQGVDLLTVIKDTECLNVNPPNHLCIMAFSNQKIN